MSPASLLCPLASALCAKRARRKEARPGELLAAALDLFVEKGFAGTRVEEVAKRAGVSKGTLFLYFPSKEELFKAVVRENLSGNFGAWDSEIDHYTGSSANLLRYAVHSWWQQVGGTKVSGICKLMMSEASNFPELAQFYDEEVIQPGNALMARVLQRGIERGEFYPMDLQYGVYTVLAPLLFLATWTQSFGALPGMAQRIPPQEFITLQLETLLRGLCPPGTAPQTAAPQVKFAPT